jgi:peptidyl-prolyl cis-trans isomerase C
MRYPDTRFRRAAGAALAGLALWALPAVGQQPQAPQPNRPQAAQPDKPLATVNGSVIRQSTYEQLIKQAVDQGNPDTPELREAIKKQLIARELFLQEAAKQNLDKDPEVLAATEEAKRNAMLQHYLRAQLKLNPVTDEQARAHYEQVKAGMGTREYKLRAIMLPSEARAKEIRDQLAKGKDFGELARQWSLAPSAARGGELDWLSFKTPAKEGETQGLPLALARAVEKLQKGKVAEPVEVRGQWWILKLEDVRPTRLPSFEEAKAGIYRMLQARELERATSELMARLSKGATITQ